MTRFYGVPQIKKYVPTMANMVCCNKKKKRPFELFYVIIPVFVESPIVVRNCSFEISFFLYGGKFEVQIQRLVSATLRITRFDRLRPLLFYHSTTGYPVFFVCLFVPSLAPFTHKWCTQRTKTSQTFV